MPVPNVSWRTRDNTSQVTQWQIGTVDAGTVSPDFGFLIWNNYQESSDVSDMEDCSITTKDELGGNTGDVVTGQWIWVRNDSAGDGNFHQVGFDVGTNAVVAYPIGTNGTTTFNGVSSTPNVAPHTSAKGTVSILGVANDGTKQNSAGNFVEVTLHARVPGNAVAGLMKFLTRVSYSFV